MGRKNKIKNCIVCNKELELNDRPNKKYCRDCLLKRTRECTEKWQKSKKGKEWLKRYWKSEKGKFIKSIQNRKYIEKKKLMENER